MATKVRMLRSLATETGELARGDTPTVADDLAASWIEDNVAEAWSEPDGLPGAAVDDLTNAEEFVLFTPNEGGDTVDAFVSTKVTFNPSNGKLTAVGLIGDVTGDLTGNVTGNVDGDLDGDAERVAPVAGVSTQAGVALNLEASAATAGSTNAGAGAGGAVTIKSGAAARKTSGDANGGAITLTPGAGTGAGVAGTVGLAGNTNVTGNLAVSADSKAASFTLADLNAAPASASAPGTKGEIRFTAAALYLCTDTDTWVKVALATWA
jgi:CheY-specific phosphatase CheX